MKFFKLFLSSGLVPISESEYSEALAASIRPEAHASMKVHQAGFQYMGYAYLAIDPTLPVGEVSPKSSEGLKSQVAYWDPARPEIIESLKKDPKTLNQTALVNLVMELDRRFMQLWDKVKFERDKKLIDYGKLTSRSLIPPAS